VEYFKSTHLIEILDRPQRPQYYTVEDFEQENRKFSALHVELDVQYEDRLRKYIIYLIDKIDWPTLYEQLEKVINTWEELKACDDALKLVVNKLSKRNENVTLLCFFVISLSCEHIEKAYYCTSDLAEFDDKRVPLQRRIISYHDKYKSVKFELFPHAIDKRDKLKNKEEWA